MAVEIERKFLVDADRLPPLVAGTRICQGYIPTQDHTAVRIRICAEKAFLTIKGENSGARRLEFEYAIPMVDAEEMLAAVCGSGVVEKTRHELTVGEHVWELDIFHGNNTGLIVAEIELSIEDESFQLPPWVTQEVTGDTKYYNSSLIGRPFCAW